MQRRALLASAGSSLAALSGCLLFSGERGQRTRTGTLTPNETTPTPSSATPTPEVTIESTIQQWGFIATNDDAVSFVDARGQYLVFEVSVEAGFYEQSEFTLLTGSRKISPTEANSFYRTRWGQDQWYEQGNERGVLLYEYPEKFEGEPPRLTWPSGEWRADESLVRRLTTPRPPMNASVSVPGASDGSTEKTVRVEVTNEGDVEGRYLGGLNRVGPAIAYAPVARVSGLVAAGETETFLVADDWMEYPSTEDRGDGETDVTYRLQDADGGDSLDVAVSE